MEVYVSTTTKFTQGPWFSQHDEIAGHYNIATVDAERGSEAVALVFYVANEPAGRGEADAHLIAAAPELYEALIAVLEGVHGARADEDLDCSTDAGGYLLGDVMNDALIAADKALAKARGEAL